MVSTGGNDLSLIVFFVLFPPPSMHTFTLSSNLPNNKTLKAVDFPNSCLVTSYSLCVLSLTTPPFYFPTFFLYMLLIRLPKKPCFDQSAVLITIFFKLGNMKLLSLRYITTRLIFKPASPCLSYRGLSYF